MTSSIFLLLIFAGIFSGFFGAIVGASLTVVVPLLVFLGLDIYSALGTGTAACCARGITSTRNYIKVKAIDLSLAIKFAVPYLTATVIGSYCALNADENILKNFIFFCILLVAALILINPKLGIESKPKNFSSLSKNIAIIAGGIATGFYNGIFGGGVTIFLIFIFVYFFSFEFLKAAATTAFLAFLGDFTCSVVFALNDKLNYTYALPLILGMLLGGDLGSRSAISKGNNFVRIIFATVVFLLAIKFLVFN